MVTPNNYPTATLNKIKKLPYGCLLMVGHGSAEVLCVSLSVLCLLTLPLSLYFLSPFLRFLPLIYLISDQRFFLIAIGMISNKYDIMKVCFKTNLHIHDFYVSQLNILKTIDGH